MRKPTTGATGLPYARRSSGLNAHRPSRPARGPDGVGGDGRPARPGQRLADGMGTSDIGGDRLLCASGGPGELDLELGPVVLDLELHLQLDLIRDPDLELKSPALELDVVVAGQGVGERVQSVRGDFAAHALLLCDLEQFHGLTLRRTLRSREGA